MQQEKNVRMFAKEISKDTKDGRKLAKEFSNVGKKLRILGKSPGKLGNFLRKVGKVPRKLADVFSQQHSAAPKLGETRFRLAFFSRNISGEKSKVVFSFRNTHEEKSKDAFSFGKVHPATILHTFSVFVLKQRALVRNPAGTVDNGNAVQRTQIAGREAIAHSVQKPAKRPSCGPVVSEDETVRKNTWTPEPSHVACCLSTIQRTEHSARATVEDMRVDLCRRNVLVAQQFLHRADVVTHFQQMRRERMPQCMRAQRLEDSGPLARSLQAARQDRVVEMMASLDALARVDGALRGRKHELPAEVARSVRILARQRMRQPCCTEARSDVGGMQQVRAFDFALHWFDQ